MKIRMKFEKNLKYISHLDLMKTMQKTLKRTGFNLKYSEGFNPHIILSIANPLPVGILGGCEFADFEISDNLSRDEILNRLIISSPKEIKPVDLFFDCKKSSNLTEYATYEINIITKEPEKIKNLISKNELLTEKKSKGKLKTINLKDYIKEVKFTDTKFGITLNLICSCGNTRNLNPLLLKKAILENDIHIESFSGIRTGLFDADMKDLLS